MLHTADSCSRHGIRSFLSDKMFAVNRFVVAPSGTVSTGAQNRGARRSAAAYELTERPQVAGWQRRLLLAERLPHCGQQSLRCYYSSDTRNNWLTQVAAG